MKTTLVVLMVAVLQAIPAGTLLAQGGATPGGAAAGPTPPPPASGGLAQAVLNPIGIGLALLFVVLMVNLFRWMFRVPPLLPWSVVKARQSVSALHRLLVPTGEDGSAGRVVELACRLGEAQKAEILLAYVLEVPFTLSLGESMPEEEARAREALRTAQFIVAQHGLPVRTQFLPHRSAWGGILQLARQEMVDAIIMGVASGRPGQVEGVSRTVQEVLKRAECEVILDKSPRWGVS